MTVSEGMRLGELLVLTWADIDLRSKTVRVRPSYSGGAVTTPKNHERRDVDLTDEVVELLGAWWGECGGPVDEHLVFPGKGRDGFLDPSNINRRKLYPTMERAGIPREGPTGEKRTFHSFRHTFANRALESGRQIIWLSKHLGHSSLKVTTDVYGHWERAERKREAEEMEGVLGV